MDKKPLTRKEKRALRQKAANQNNAAEKLNFVLKNISPLTENQRTTFQSYQAGKNLMLHGSAGTGKSFISLYLALNEILNGNSPYKKVVIVRSVVEVRKMGFQPGKEKDKIKVYELPYYAICAELFGRGDAYEYLKNKNMVEFISTSFIRGITLNDTIVIVDEIANMNLHELDSVITRVGKNCKIVFCGDFTQSDFTNDYERDGLKEFIRIINRMKSFTFVEFNETDIVRSGVVKDYIIQKNRLGIVA